MRGINPRSISSFEISLNSLVLKLSYSHRSVLKSNLKDYILQWLILLRAGHRKLEQFFDSFFSICRITACGTLFRGNASLGERYRNTQRRQRHQDAEMRKKSPLFERAQNV